MAKQVTIKELDGNVIILQKKIGKLKASELTAETIKFVRNDLKTFEFYISRKLCDIYEKHGVIISTDPTKEEIDKINSLNIKVDIIDCHEKSNELIVYRKNRRTVIYYDDLLEVANEIVVHYE